MKKLLTKKKALEIVREVEGVIDHQTRLSHDVNECLGTGIALTEGLRSRGVPRPRPESVLQGYAAL